MVVCLDDQNVPPKYTYKYPRRMSGAECRYSNSASLRCHMWPQHWGTFNQPSTSIIMVHNHRLRSIIFCTNSLPPFSQSSQHIANIVLPRPSRLCIGSPSLVAWPSLPSANTNTHLCVPSSFIPILFAAAILLRFSGFAVHCTLRRPSAPFVFDGSSRQNLSRIPIALPVT